MWVALNKIVQLYHKISTAFTHIVVKFDMREFCIKLLGHFYFMSTDWLQNLEFLGLVVVAKR